MSVISVATTKGGAGKTTTAINLTGESLRRGFRVAAIDADPKRDYWRWASATQKAGFSKDLSLGMVDCESPALNADPAAREAVWKEASGCGLMVVHDLDASRMIPNIIKLQASHDVVIVDLQGSANQSMVMAFGRSDLVLIPSTASAFDLMAAAETLRSVKSTAQMVNRDIKVLGLLTQTMAMTDTRAAKSTRENLVKKAGLPVMQAELISRSAFRDLTFTGSSPSLSDPEGNAALNVSSIWVEVFALITGKEKEAVNG